MCRVAALVAAGLASGILFYAQTGTTRSVRDGVYADRQADRGIALYHEHCDRCHGEDMEGDEAPELAGSEFLADWKGLTLGDVFERIRVAMPGDHPGLLTREQCADVLALILRANHFPAGPRELEGDTRALKQIRMETR